MSTKWAFYKYDPDLDIDALAQQGQETLEAELRSTRQIYERLDAIFEESLDGFFVTDGEGRVIRVNKAYEEMCGVKAEEILGKHMSELESWTISHSASLIVLKTRQPVTIEQEYLRTRRHAYITSVPVFNDRGEIVMIVSNNRDFREIERLRRQLEDSQQRASKSEDKLLAISKQLASCSKIIARDKKTMEVIYLAAKVAATDCTALIQGETGTGKEEIAKFIHQNSPRADRPFIRINCGAISKSLIEAELFGYEKGAFTGANSSGRVGYFEVADGGTLFLDEIGELPFDLQSKLLRVLQDKEITRVGGTRPIPVNIRVLAATNRNLMEMVEKGLFRKDLYYRLSVIPIRVPPLRERREDIVPLIDHFLQEYNEKFHTSRTLSPYAYKDLSEYQWPGNVRELKNTIEQMMILSESDIISTANQLFGRPALLEERGDEPIQLKSILERIEYEYIKKYCGEMGTLQKAADKLGMNLKTLSRRKKYFENLYSDPNA